MFPDTPQRWKEYLTVNSVVMEDTLGTRNLAGLYAGVPMAYKIGLKRNTSVFRFLQEPCKVPGQNPMDVTFLYCLLDWLTEDTRPFNKLLIHFMVKLKNQNARFQVNSFKFCLIVNNTVITFYHY